MSKIHCLVLIVFVSHCLFLLNRHDNPASGGFQEHSKPKYRVEVVDKNTSLEAAREDLKQVESLIQGFERSCQDQQEYIEFERKFHAEQQRQHDSLKEIRRTLAQIEDPETRELTTEADRVLGKEVGYIKQSAGYLEDAEKKLAEMKSYLPDLYIRRNAIRKFLR